MSVPPTAPIESNTKALEERGWKGICIDPFPTNMQGRTCTMVKDVVSSVSGQTIKFHTSQALGGIADTLGKWKEVAEQAPTVEFTTIDARRRFSSATDAPSFIHFMSLDIEGAELEALQGHPVRQVPVWCDGHRAQRRGAQAHRTY